MIITGNAPAGGAAPVVVVQGGAAAAVTVYVYENGNTVSITADGSPVTLAASSTVEGAKEFTAPRGALLEVTTTAADVSESVYPDLQSIVDDGDYLFEAHSSNTPPVLVAMPFAVISA